MIGNLSKIVVSLNIVLSLSVMAVPQILGPEPLQVSEWQIEIVDSEGSVGITPSLALDSNDYPHISYNDHTNEDLKYVSWNGSAWVFEVVDTAGEAGWRSSLALDSNEYPHISYLGDGDTRYARWTGSAWNIETVDPSGDNTYDTSLALDGNDYPHISYHDWIKRDLKYANWNGSNWNIETIDSEGGVGEWSSLALDGNDFPHISYDARHNLSYARWTGSNWNIETVDLNAVWTSMALDGNEFPHISYFDSLNSSLKYAKWTGSAWEIEIVDNTSKSTGWWSSIALDSNDLPRIAYYTEVPHLLKYAKWTGNNWSIEVIDYDYMGWWPSLALDSNDNPHVAYNLAGSDWDLRYATKVEPSGNNPPVADAGPDQTVYVGDIVQFDGSGSHDPDAGWETMTVDTGDVYGETTSLALDSNDNPHVSYYDYTNEDLKYARWTGSNWIIETADSSLDVGWMNSIALDSYDYPRISYYDWVNRDLKYARWTGSNWSIEIVDSLGEVGKYTSIAVDSNDNPHISYWDYTNEDLKYARWTGSNWSIETVDSADEVGLFTSIALDNNNLPHISYFDVTNNDLKYARWTGSKWVFETVDTDGLYSSLALDSADFTHIGYRTGDYIKYARWTGSNWSIETVDYGGAFVGDASLALDNDDNPHMAYMAYPSKDLKYARWTGSVWSIETADSNISFPDRLSIGLDSNGKPHISYVSSPDQNLKYAKKAGGIVSYDWNFGDGSPHGSGVKPIHIYSSPDIYNVTLTVTDAQGAADIDNCIITVLSRNQPPVANANGPYDVNEGTPITLDGSNSYDPDGDTLQYRWDLNNDGIWDTGWSSSPYHEHTWGDDHSGNVVLQVSDGEFKDTDTANITVRNVAPTVELRMLPIYVNVSLRIAGEKWHDVSAKLHEDDVLVAVGSLTRYPGSPNDQTLSLAYLTVDISKKYSAIVRYTPEDDPINGQPNGANPCWIALGFSDVEELRIHHTFNVQHPETYLWEVDLTSSILSHVVTFEGRAIDPGADDLTFYWDFGDGTGMTHFFANNGVFPMLVEETVTHDFPGSGTYLVTLTVEDDDGGICSAKVSVGIP